jgi:hypothetical protein
MLLAESFACIKYTCIKYTCIKYNGSERIGPRCSMTGGVSVQKQAILQVLDELPEEVDVDELLDRIILLEKIDEAEKCLAAGEGLNHEEAKRRMESWLK